MTKDQAERQLYVGAITGTSVDGLDIALVDVSGTIAFIAGETLAFPANLRHELLALGQPGSDDLDQLGEVDRALGHFIGQGILSFLKSHKFAPTDITAIGSHGQTVRHRPDAAQPFTWQIGDPNMIAEVTRVTTVADFRRRDMSAGGQGAPLVPRFHEALFRLADEDRAILNIGGISNLTMLTADPAIDITGFDTGPGNALMDVWCEAQTGNPYDVDGAMAAKGSVDDALLQQLLSDPYLSRPPPKSTGREHYNLDWLKSQLSRTATAQDVQRTLLEFTAVSIEGALATWAASAQRLIVCGGGRANPLLLNRLRTLLTIPVDTAEDHGYDGDMIEAAAFGWLAHLRLAGLAGSAGSVTGADGNRILGAIYSA